MVNLKIATNPIFERYFCGLFFYNSAFFIRESFSSQCTPHKHIDQRKWCSVEVDGGGVHVSGGGRWGNCDPVKCGKTAPRPMTTTNMDNCGRICSTVSEGEQ